MIKDKVKSVLSLNGKNQIELAEHLGMTKQSLSNKLNRNYLNSDDLIKLSLLCGCELSFKMKDGSKVILDENDINTEKKKTGIKKSNP